MPSRFVILHHTTPNGEHWDLMLEHGDVLLTWQLLKEPTGPESLPIPAKRIADHRKLYLDYEGPLSGGRGEVRLVDKGTLEWISTDPKFPEFRLQGNHFAGCFCFSSSATNKLQLELAAEARMNPITDSTLETILHCWKLTGARLHVPAKSLEITACETALNRELPHEFSALYQATNGATIIGGNLMIHPMCGGDFSVEGHSDFLRNYNWPIPDELVVFGDNGGSELFGIWISRQGACQPIIVEVGAIFENGCMSIVGTTLLRFLRGWTTYYLLLEEVPTECLDLLAVPMSLRDHDLDDELFDTVMRWSDAKLPSTPLSSYDAQLDRSAVARFAHGFLANLGA